MDHLMGIAYEYLRHFDGWPHSVEFWKVTIGRDNGLYRQWSINVYGTRRLSPDSTVAVSPKLPISPSSMATSAISPDSNPLLANTLPDTPEVAELKYQLISLILVFEEVERHLCMLEVAHAALKADHARLSLHFDHKASIMRELDALAVNAREEPFPAPIPVPDLEAMRGVVVDKEYREKATEPARRFLQCFGNKKDMDDLEYGPGCY
ncbi:hypothetical protein NMY22_g7425 [Coprinellus aureogranulatus]|nr:hypothetical protein NMY22_g7425 [Coprinellus aureogranulatus]